MKSRKIISEAHAKKIVQDKLTQTGALMNEVKQAVETDSAEAFQTVTNKLNKASKEMKKKTHALNNAGAIDLPSLNVTLIANIKEARQMAPSRFEQAKIKGLPDSIRTEWNTFVSEVMGLAHEVAKLGVFPAPKKSKV